MALLDSILPFIDSVEQFTDYPVVAQNISRGRIITSIQASPRIWTFKLKVALPPMVWSSYYDFLEDLRAVNMSSPFVFSFTANPKLSYLTPYRGTLNSTEQAAATVAAKGPASPTSLNLANLPVNRTNAFRKGDFIQAVGDPKPYTVLMDINSSSTGTATLNLSRPLFTYPAVGTALTFGAPQWTCYFSSLPAPSSVSTYLNGLQWQGSFEFTETA